MPKTRSLFAGLGAIAVTALCGASVYTMIVPQTPRVLYNKSDSAPIGWYKLDPEGAPVRDAMVAAFAPQEARNLADLRDYLPSHIPLLKSVWAVAGKKSVLQMELYEPQTGLISTPQRGTVWGGNYLIGRDASRLKQTKSSSCLPMYRIPMTVAISGQFPWTMFWVQPNTLGKIR